MTGEDPVFSFIRDRFDNLEEKLDKGFADVHTKMDTKDAEFHTRLGEVEDFQKSQKRVITFMSAAWATVAGFFKFKSGAQ